MRGEEEEVGRGWEGEANCVVVRRKGGREGVGGGSQLRGGEEEGR